MEKFSANQSLLMKEFLLKDPKKLGKNHVLFFLRDNTQNNDQL